MARTTLNRLDLRRASEAAKALEAAAGDAGGAAGGVATPKAKKPKAAKAPRKSAKSKAPVRMRVRWAVFNDSMKQVAVFDYAQRSDADQKAADQIGKGKGHHFVQAVKEPMPEPETA
jgi:hypothetical protein